MRRRRSQQQMVAPEQRLKNLALFYNWTDDMTNRVIQIFNSERLDIADMVEMEAENCLELENDFWTHKALLSLAVLIRARAREK